MSIALYLELSILLFSENNKMTFAMFFSFRITMHRWSLFSFSLEQCFLHRLTDRRRMRHTTVSTQKEREHTRRGHWQST